MRFAPVLVRALKIVAICFVGVCLVVPVAAQGERAAADGQPGSSFADGAGVSRAREFEWPSGFEGRVEF